MGEMDIRQAFEAAVAHHRAGRLREAEAIYRNILSADPNDADALHMLGLLAHHTGRPAAALELIRSAIGLYPDAAPFHNNLGLVLAGQAAWEQAIAAFGRAVALLPDMPEAHNNLGSALRNAGRLEEAIASHRQAIALRQDMPEAHDALGVALKEKDLLDEAIAEHERAIKLRPNFAIAYSNLADALRLKKQFEESIAACRRAIAILPNNPEPHVNLANALAETEQPDEATAEYRAAIALRPDLAEAHKNLAGVLKDVALLDEAMAEYRAAELIKPSPTTGDNLLYTSYYHPRYGSAAILAEHRAWNDRYAAPLISLIRPLETDRSANRRLRIGHVSPDFRDHCLSFFTIPLFKHHDHASFELFCYSNVARPDEITARIRGYADEWRDVSRMGDQQVGDLIRKDRIDILVDHTLHMAGNRLLVFAQKPAPVQATWIAYPGTSGLTTMDYRLSDPHLDPLAAVGEPTADPSAYSERTICLPHTFWCYDPRTEEPPVNDLPAIATGHITFGCLNNFCKINEGTLDLWAKVLSSTPDSRLLLLAPRGSARERVAGRLRRGGVDPSRVEFVSRQPRQRYLELYHRIDLCLDTIPYTGHTTTLDALWMGVPTVTLAGQTAVSRGGKSILTNAGLGNLVAQSNEQFQQIAISLAHDLPQLRELRSILRQRMQQSPLMNAPQFARGMEAAYRRMWREFQES